MFICGWGIDVCMGGVLRFKYGYLNLVSLCVCGIYIRVDGV